MARWLCPNRCLLDHMFDDQFCVRRVFLEQPEVLQKRRSGLPTAIGNWCCPSKLNLSKSRVRGVCSAVDSAGFPCKDPTGYCLRGNSNSSASSFFLSADKVVCKGLHRAGLPDFRGLPLGRAHMSRSLRTMHLSGSLFCVAPRCYHVMSSVLSCSVQPLGVIMSCPLCYPVYPVAVQGSLNDDVNPTTASRRICFCSIAME